MLKLNETHRPELRSWVISANDGTTDFPIQNLPFAIFRRAGSSETFRAGVAIGDQIVDLKAADLAGVFPKELTPILQTLHRPQLNNFMALGNSTWSLVRLGLSRALRKDAAEQEKLKSCLVDQAEAEFKIPARIGDYTDFYTSIHHATNIGKLFRPDNPLLSNYQWVPIAYHGRSSSINVSGHGFHRPIGQLKTLDSDTPVVGPCKRLDYELEVGVFIGKGNELGRPIKLDDAENHVFGLCLFNDWTARDIQAWESQPLGSFLSNSFASTVSPWIVTMEALMPYREGWGRPADHPKPLPYLDSRELRTNGALDMQLEAHIQTAKMCEQNIPPKRLCLSNFNQSYWSISQMVAHHSLNGCNLKSGDLLGSGTMSGPNSKNVGSLIEATLGGIKPFVLGKGESRTFLQDGDTVILKGHCESGNAPRIGFGEARATILPAIKT